MSEPNKERRTVFMKEIDETNRDAEFDDEFTEEERAVIRLASLIRRAFSVRFQDGMDHDPEHLERFLPKVAHFIPKRIDQLVEHRNNILDVMEYGEIDVQTCRAQIEDPKILDEAVQEACFQF